MVEDPNETARRAFGEGPPMPPAPAPSSAAARAPSTRSVGALAEWGTRAAAFTLDALFLFGLAFVVAIVVVVAVGSDDRRTVETIVYAVCIPLGLLYAPLLMARRGTANGQTLGKQMMDIRVVRVDGSRVTLWNGFLRQVLAQQLLTALTVYVYAIVDYLWPLRDPRNQALHDKIAGTLVVRTKTGGLPQRPAAAALSDTDADQPLPPSPRRMGESPVHGWLPPSSGS
ncbi:MAG TPA: RDD family protein [Conexibacter sp.]|nr:RDD family protein [Conexibacter sp.]